MKCEEPGCTGVHSTKKPVAERCPRVTRRRRQQYRSPEAVARRRDELLRVRYGISTAEYELLLAKQGGVCALCKRDSPEPTQGRGGRRRLAVDHSSVTGRVRGLLCHPCNTALGRLGDEPDALRRVLEYVA